jgi:predicted  nucleic acid-binding Zn-ribbon protein
MDENALARQLHDRSTRGEVLSVGEQADLEAWYAREDEAERRLLKASGSSQSLATLQEQVDAALGRVAAVSRRIDELTRENETIRHEISALQQQLARTLAASAR